MTCCMMRGRRSEHPADTDSIEPTKLSTAAAYCRPPLVGGDFAAEGESNGPFLHQLCGLATSFTVLFILVLGGAVVGVSTRLITRGLERISLKSNKR